MYASWQWETEDADVYAAMVRAETLAAMEDDEDAQCAICGDSIAYGTLCDACEEGMTDYDAGAEDSVSDLDDAEAIHVERQADYPYYPEIWVVRAVSQWYMEHPNAEALPPVIMPEGPRLDALDVFDAYGTCRRMPPVPVMNDSRDDRDRRRHLHR